MKKTSLLVQTAQLCLVVLFQAAPSRASDVTVNPGGNIQAALDQVGDSGGGTVYVNSGTYNISDTLFVPNNTRLKGVTTRPVINMASGANKASIRPKTRPFNTVNCDFLAINGGLTLSQINSGNYWGTDGVHYSSGDTGTNGYVYNCNISNCCGAITMGEVTNGIIDGVNITTCGMMGTTGPGMHNMYISNTDPFTIKNTTSTNCITGAGLKISDSDNSRTETSQTVENCNFSGNPGGRGVMAYNISPIVVKNTISDNCSQVGIFLSKCGNVTLTGNHTTGNAFRKDNNWFDIHLLDCWSVTQSGNVYGHAYGAGTTLKETGEGMGQLIANGTYRVLNTRSWKALDVTGGSNANGAKVIQWPYGNSDSTNQQWTITHLGNEKYKIINAKSGKSLDVEGGSTADGANIIQYTYSGSSNQTWSIEAAGGNFKLTANHSGKSLDVSGGSTADGAQVIQWPYGGSTNQIWFLGAP